MLLTLLKQPKVLLKNFSLLINDILNSKKKAKYGRKRNRIFEFGSNKIYVIALLVGPNVPKRLQLESRSESRFQV